MFARALRSWHRLVLQREMEATRASLTAWLNLGEPAEDASRYASLACEGHTCTLHVIASRGRSLQAVRHLENHIVPHALSAPRQWLFLIETSAPCPDPPLRDQYRLARSIAVRFGITAPPDPFAALSHEEVIQAALRHGLPQGVTPDDLYGALCYDCLPKRRNTEPIQKGLGTARVLEALHPRREALRLLHLFQWNLDTARMESIVTHVLKRIEAESPWALDEFYDGLVRPLLAQQTQTLNRLCLKQWLEHHPRHEFVLVMMDEHHLPLRLAHPRDPACGSS